MNARKFLVFTDLFDVDISIESPTEGDQEVTEKMKLERKDIKDKYYKDKPLSNFWVGRNQRIRH